jgi:hypothetical protein
MNTELEDCIKLIQDRLRFATPKELDALKEVIAWARTGWKYEHPTEHPDDERQGLGRHPCYEKELDYPAHF